MVWENQFVEENNLTVHIAVLRKALGETKNNNQLIITVPGRGYRFVGELVLPGENKLVATDLLGAAEISENRADLINSAKNEIVIRKEALETIKELEQLSQLKFGNSQWIAKIYLLLGEKEDGIKRLEKGFEAETIGAFYKDEPVWDSVRPDSRFIDLTKKMVIP